MATGIISLLNSGNVQSNSIVQGKAGNGKLENMSRLNIDERSDQAFGATGATGVVEEKNSARVSLTLEQLNSRQTDDQNKEQALENRRAVELSERNNERESGLERFLEKVVRDFQPAGDKADNDFPDFRAISLINGSVPPPTNENIKPDFKAISLIHGSLPHVDTFISGEPDFKAIGLINRSLPPIENRLPEATGENQAANIDASAPEREPASERMSERAHTVARQLAGANAEKSLEKFENYSSEALSRIEERIQESATSMSSDEIASKREPTAITPAQAEGIEAYERFQNYSNVTIISFARVSI